MRAFSRHNYYLPDTHHRLISRVLHGRNRHRLMTEGMPPLSRPFTSSRTSLAPGKLFLLLGAVHHACQSPPDVDQRTFLLIMYLHRAIGTLFAYVALRELKKRKRKNRKRDCFFPSGLLSAFTTLCGSYS